MHIALVAASLDILGGHGVQANALMQGLRSDGYTVSFIPINPRFPAGLRWLPTESGNWSTIERT